MGDSENKTYSGEISRCALGSSYFGGMNFVHLSGANLLFLDGHVKWYSKGDIIFADPTTLSVSQNQGYHWNRQSN
jgi:prepilin-type processing-associated H-X9-DG protein